MSSRSLARSPQGRRFVQTLLSTLSISICVVCVEEPTLAEDGPRRIEGPVSNHDQAIEGTDVSPFRASDPNLSIILTGRVWRTKPGIVFLKTPLGQLSLSSKTALKDLLASQVVTFWAHGVHWAVDIRRRSDGSLVHRYLGGPFKRSETAERALLRWTPEGEKTFEFGSYERLLAGLHQGDSVTIEVDETDAIVGVHDMQFDLQIGQLPTGRSDAHLVLTGIVDKLKSNFIFLRTPLGIVNVNATIGIRHIRVGQTLTLYIHGRHLVADVSAPNSRSVARRFVTGPLEFASPDRTSVKLWTPEGKQIYLINTKDHRPTVLAGLKEGHSITAELDETGHIVEFHRSN